MKRRGCNSFEIRPGKSPRELIFAVKNGATGKTTENTLQLIDIPATINMLLLYFQDHITDLTIEDAAAVLAQSRKPMAEYPAFYQMALTDNRQSLEVHLGACVLKFRHVHISPTDGGEDDGTASPAGSH